MAAAVRAVQLAVEQPEKDWWDWNQSKSKSGFLPRPPVAETQHVKMWVSWKDLNSTIKWILNITLRCISVYLYWTKLAVELQSFNLDQINKC